MTIKTSSSDPYPYLDSEPLPPPSPDEHRSARSVRARPMRPKLLDRGKSRDCGIIAASLGQELTAIREDLCGSWNGPPSIIQSQTFVGGYSGGQVQTHATAKINSHSPIHTTPWPMLPSANHHRTMNMTCTMAVAYRNQSRDFRPYRKHVSLAQKTQI